VSGFPSTIVEFWGAAGIVLDPTLAHDRRVSLLRTTDGAITLRLTPDLAAQLDLADASEAAIRAALAAADIRLHGADCLFYYRNRPSAVGTSVRRLTANDAAAFAEFQASASEQDLDDAFVELNHWAVFGAFDRGRLVCAASMYPWGGARIADTGVLTLPEFRGRGHARDVVRAISAYALSERYEPQYRCQVDNVASRALAASAGLDLFGTWEVVSPD